MSKFTGLESNLATSIQHSILVHEEVTRQFIFEGKVVRMEDKSTRHSRGKESKCHVQPIASVLKSHNKELEFIQSIVT